jgi:predicted nucleotidyltransferase
MLQNYNKWKVLQVFFEQPLAESGLQLREISRKTKLAPTSVKNYLQELKKEQLILEKKSRVQNYPVYFANRDEDNFKLYKKIDLIIRIKQSGLLEYIYDSCLPNTIILFGSSSRGEDTESSDIDIFLQSSEKKLNIKKHEKILNKEINLFFESKFSKLSLELKNNIINGIVLQGYLKVF